MTFYAHLIGDDSERGFRVSQHHSTENDPISSYNDFSIGEQIFENHQRRRAIILFSACTILLFADQNLMSPNLTAIANDFGFNADERDKKLGGDIALAFFVLGAPASFVVGCLADSYNRSRLFAWTVGIGEAACLATFFTSTYIGLYICRAITGFALGGALPLIYSVLGDLFKADERHGVNAVVGIGTGAGISLGQSVAGFLGPIFGWRFPFLLISTPALICAVAVFLYVEDPERGGMEDAVLRQRALDAEDREPSTLEMAPLEESPRASVSGSDSLRYNRDDDQRAKFSFTVHLGTFISLVSTPTVVLALLQGAPGCVPWGVVNSFLNDYLSENRGMTVQFATLTMLVFGLGNFFGLILGGAGGTYLYRLDVRYPVLLSGSMAIVGCFPFWFLINSIDNKSSPVSIIIVSILAGLTIGVTGPIVKATLQNVTLPQSRGQAFALFNTFDDFGRGLGPVFVSRLIVSMGGRRPAFNIGVLGWILCGVFNLCMFLTVDRDERWVQRRLASTIIHGTAQDDGEVIAEDPKSC